MKVIPFSLVFPGGIPRFLFQIFNFPRESNLFGPSLLPCFGNMLPVFIQIITCCKIMMTMFVLFDRGKDLTLRSV